MVLLGHDSGGEEQLVSKLIAEGTLGKGLTSKVVVSVVVGTTKDWHALCFGLVSWGKWGVWLCSWADLNSCILVLFMFTAPDSLYWRLLELFHPLQTVISELKWPASIYIACPPSKGIKSIVYRCVYLFSLSLHTSLMFLWLPFTCHWSWWGKAGLLPPPGALL